MKTFTYTARSSSGQITKGNVQAEDRTSALSKIKEQKLIPISIVDQAAQPAAETSKRHLMLLIVGAFVLTIGVMIFMTKNEGHLQQKKKTIRGEIVHVDGVSQETKKEEAVIKKIYVSEKNVLSEPSNKKGNDAISEQSQTNAVTDGEALQITNAIPPKMFNSGVEQVLSLIANTKPGSPVPPLLKLHKKENMEEILNKDIVLYDEDNEVTAEKKANVAHAKQLLKEYLSQGGKAEDFLAYYHGELKKAHTDWREAQMKAMTLLKGNDPEAAAKYIEEINRAFSQRGIKPIILPKSQP